MTTSEKVPERRVKGIINESKENASDNTKMKNQRERKGFEHTNHSPPSATRIPILLLFQAHAIHAKFAYDISRNSGPMVFSLEQLVGRAYWIYRLDCGLVLIMRHGFSFSESLSLQVKVSLVGVGQAQWRRDLVPLVAPLLMVFW